MDGFNYNVTKFTDTATGEVPQTFGAYDLHGNPIQPTLPPGNYFGEPGDAAEENDPKRRRIARVGGKTNIS